MGACGLSTVASRVAEADGSLVLTVDRSLSTRGLVETGGEKHEVPDEVEAEYDDREPRQECRPNNEQGVQTIAAVRTDALVEDLKLVFITWSCRWKGAVRQPQHRLHIASKRPRYRRGVDIR